MITIMQDMGWDYETYISQPVWIIELLFEKLSIDSKKANKQTKR